MHLLHTDLGIFKLCCFLFIHLFLILFTQDLFIYIFIISKLLLNNSVSDGLDNAKIFINVEYKDLCGVFLN